MFFQRQCLLVPELTHVYLTRRAKWILYFFERRVICWIQNCSSDKIHFWPRFTIWVQRRAPPLKVNISLNYINICCGDIWTSIWLRMSCIWHNNTCCASKYKLMREYVIWCGGHLEIQYGRQLNSEYYNDYLIIRHIFPHE
jgi:hypothetical protein